MVPLSLGGGIGGFGVFLTYVKVFLLRVLLGLSYSRGFINLILKKGYCDSSRNPVAPD